MANDLIVTTGAPNLVALLTQLGGGKPASLDRARGVVLGLAVGNLLGIPVESGWARRIASNFPGGVTKIDPQERHRELDDDLAQAVDLGEAQVAGGGRSPGGPVRRPSHTTTLAGLRPPTAAHGRPGPQIDGPKLVGAVHRRRRPKS